MIAGASARGVSSSFSSEPAREAEVGIVGAGPAGARAAELLADLGVGVLCFDPRAPWEKPCGGGLPAAVFRNVPELAELKSRGQEIRRVRLASLNGATVVISFREHLYVVSRRDLAVWQLARARAAGAQLVAASVVDFERFGHGWRLRDRRGREYRVRRLVGADGAASRVRRLVAPSFRPELAPTRVAYPTTAAPFGSDEVLFAFFAGVDGYLWDFPRPDHRSVGVGLLPGRWRRPRMDEAVRRYLAEGDVGRRDGERDDALRMKGAVIGTAMWPEPGFRLIGASDYALLGDAAGLADPATGEGIEKALRSAGLLAESYVSRRDFALYPAAARAAFLREFRVARMLRWCLYRGSLAEAVIELALRRPWVHGLLRGLVDCENERRGVVALLGVLGRFSRSEGGRPDELALVR